jgi:formamidopyrimidine-DNA glycosylase
MPELPEVEIVKRSLKNNVKYKKIKKVIISNRNLRFKIQKNFGGHIYYQYSKVFKIYNSYFR